jgi:hypothetical protein
VRLRSDADAAIYRVLMAHRDAICLAPVRTKPNAIKISSDANSITLPLSGLEYVHKQAVEVFLFFNMTVFIVGVR